MIEGRPERAGTFRDQVDRLVDADRRHQLHAANLRVAHARRAVPAHRASSTSSTTPTTRRSTRRRSTTPPSTPPSRPTAPSTTPTAASDCSVPINFITGDAINGPLHSEDTLSICGSNGSGPVFGARRERRRLNDPIQARRAEHRGQSGCSRRTRSTRTATPEHRRRTSLTPPPTNAQLLQHHAAGLPLHRQDDDRAQRDDDDRHERRVAGGSKTVAFPSNGVVYVSTAQAGCGVTYTPFTANTAYTGDANCGNVYVSGNYTGSLTIASDNDIIVNGNITTTTDANGVPTTNALLGLVANDFVRVYHPVVEPAARRQASATAAPSAPERHQRPGVADEPLDLRGDPGRQPLLHRRQLRLRQLARHAQGLWRDRAALPRTGRHRRRIRQLNRLPQELPVRRPPRQRRAAVLPQPGLGRLGRFSARPSAPPAQPVDAPAQPSSADGRVEVREHGLERRARRDDSGGERRRKAVALGRVAIERRRLERRQECRPSRPRPGVAALERMRCAMRASVSCSPPRGRWRRSAPPAGRVARGTGARCARARPDRPGPPGATASASMSTPPSVAAAVSAGAGSTPSRPTLTARSIAFASAASVHRLGDEVVHPGLAAAVEVLAHRVRGDGHDRHPRRSPPRSRSRISRVAS